MPHTALFKKTVEPRIMEHFDAYILIGYSADDHMKVVDANYGRDASCRDGLRILEAAAEQWLDGSMFPKNRKRRINGWDDEPGTDKQGVK